MYVPISFSDHLAHIVTVKIQKRAPTISPRCKMIYKIKHNLVEDINFLEKIREAYPYWLRLKEGLSPTFWWENLFKKEVKRIAIIRETSWG